uniref:Uncharacterized protein n=1 Tax=Chromera velia CCMP2878 TaxID=1169474 RepID=A0A0G4I089_9ALVE|eukprot:Cvel_9891.t1-p1 / transcript=Cvel_9891.t1 / gene=Cvel_9891 / organism=Chromera_velia_CCMP2878 / gene_product=Ribonuclease P protein subunit p30, putative / transcript_product=Ribonuclease P protein subunit p30, putative / location=Cvel_scaffold583:71591-74267(-) / protein_length=352 / sequence_SO=supercontig / SO=protein_coding / is_pseudo=false
MFLDLCVPFPFDPNGTVPKGQQEALCRSLVTEAIRLGFRGLAFDVSIPLQSTQINAHKCPIPDVPVQISDPSLLSALSSFSVISQWQPLALAVSRQRDETGRFASPFLFIKRATLVATSATNIQTMKQFAQKFSDEYDLIAIKPSDDKSWLAATNEAICDIITLDLSSSMPPYRIKRAHLGVAVGRGVFFEIQLGPALKDPTARRNLFANLSVIVSFVPLERLLITSAADNPLLMRSPTDAAQLAAFMGLTPSPTAGKAVMGSNAVAALYKGAARKTVGGAVAAVPVSKREVDGDEEMGGSSEVEGVGAAAAAAGGMSGAASSRGGRGGKGSGNAGAAGKRGRGGGPGGGYN